MPAAENDLDFEWEVREDGIPYRVHMMAGCLAGMVEHSTMFPFDNIKVIKDARFGQIVRQLYSEGGVPAFYRGITLVACGSMPAHAAFFSIYELARVKFGINDEEHHPYLFGLTGAIATFVHDLIMTPIDVIKQRKQISDLPIRDIVKNLVKIEGYASILRSFPVTYAMNVPLSAILVSTNETLKLQLKKKNFNHNFFSYFACAGIAGAVASTLTTPLDVIKTKLQTQDLYQKYCMRCEKNPEGVKGGLKNPKGQISQSVFGFSSTVTKPCELNNIESFACKQAKYTSFLQALKLVIAEEGMRGLFRGFGSRIIIFSPSSAISWATYESIKKTFISSRPATAH